MAPRSATVHIAQLCPQSWAAMTPEVPGCHCAACQKTVVDFTQKTDAEILAVLKQAAGGTCGRFRAEQLARPLLPLAAQGPSRWRAWLAAAVAVWGLREGAGAPVQAQAPVEQGAGSTEQKVSKQVVTAVTPVAVAIRGVVLDSTTRQALPGVTVLLKGTNIGTSTNANGEFTLDIPFTSQQAQMLFSYVGYEPATQAVATRTSIIPITIVLHPAITLGLSEVVVAGGIFLQKPYPWHPRRFYYWLAQPFRRG